MISTVWAGSASAGQGLTLERALDLARRHNPEVLAAGEEVAASEAGLKSARGNFGPKLSVEGNVMYWDSPTRVSFFESGEDLDDPFLLPPPTTPYEIIIYEMLQGFGEPMTVREQTTKSFSVSVAQPLTPLYAIYLNYRLKGENLQATRLRRELTQGRVALRVTETFLRLLQVMRFAEIAHTAVVQVEAHLERARSFHHAGLIGLNQVLEAKLKLAEAREALIRARAAVTMTRAALSTLIGLEEHELPLPVDEFSGEEPEFTMTLEECLEGAHARRAELEEMEARIAMARTGVSLARSQLIPSLMVLANYQHTEGSRFAEEDQYFVGGVFKWDLWEWGARYYGIEEAAARERQARLVRRRVVDGITLEVRQRYLDLRGSEERLKVAQAAITHAKENLRIARHRFEANTATSTDVLDAQAALSRSRHSEVGARYDYHIALAGLRHAMGALLSR